MTIPVASTAVLVMDKVLSELATVMVGTGENGKDVNVVDGADYSAMYSDEIWVQDIKDGLTRIPVMRAGRKKREETYQLVIKVRTVRVDRRDSRVAVFAHFAAVEDWLANNPGLGLNIPTLRATTIDWSFESNYEEGNRGWRSTITISPTIESRLA